MDKGILFDMFARKCLDAPDRNIVDLFNQFVGCAPDRSLDFITENFMIFLKTGEAIRSAPAQIQASIH